MAVFENALFGFLRCCKSICFQDNQDALLERISTPPLERFQFPIDRHPLAVLAETIQNVKESRLAFSSAQGTMARTVTQLSPSFRALFSQQEIAFLENPDEQDMDLLDSALQKIQAFVHGQLSLSSSEEETQVISTLSDAIEELEPLHASTSMRDPYSENDLPQLINALFINGKIEGPQAEGAYLESWENTPAEKCRFYQVAGLPLVKGEICFINGMGISFDHAQWDADHIAEAYTQGHELHCVYGANYGAWDWLSAVYGQKGIALPQARLLVQKWGEFFAQRPSEEKYLQICTSRGAVDVVAALRLMPETLRNRIIVISLAPAYIVEEDLCYKAFNFMVGSDHVPYLAPNAHLIGAGTNVTVLPDHTDNPNAHSPHGSSYKEVIYPLVDEYIHTNNITL